MIENPGSRNSGSTLFVPGRLPPLPIRIGLGRTLGFQLNKSVDRA